MASMNYERTLSFVIVLLIIFLLYPSPSNANDVAPPSTSNEHPMYKPVDSLCKMFKPPDYCAKALKKSDDSIALAKFTLNIGEERTPEFQKHVSKLLEAGKFDDPVEFSTLLQLHCELQQAATGYAAAKLFVNNPKAINKETRDVLSRTYPWVTIKAGILGNYLVRTKGDQMTIDALKIMEELLNVANVLVSDIERNAR